MLTAKCTALNSQTGPHWEILQQAGFDVEVIVRDRTLRFSEESLRKLQTADAIVAGAETYTREILNTLPRLRVISRTGVGYDAIDLQACNDLDIVVAITPGVNHHSVAEHAIALLMGVARDFPDQDRTVRANQWKRVPGPRVMGTTLGLVGLGRIGRAVATRGVGLGMKVVAFEPSPDPEFVDRWGIELVDLDQLLSAADYISLHCPANDKTKHLINADSLRLMKPSAVLINTARGVLVDETALIDALQNGRLRGAGLDVFEQEPLPPDSPLLKFNNVLLSGHVAGLDCESNHDTFTMAAETIVQLHRGEWPAERIVNLRDIADWRWNR